jgi:YesN/AraC family two-component response regulator
VIEACNGKEGLELFKRANADLVITDIVMPEKEGIEVLIGLWEKQVPLVKTIAISGGGQQKATDYLRLAKLMGAARVFAKPFSNEALLAAINELLPGRKTSAQPTVALRRALPSTPNILLRQGYGGQVERPTPKDRAE